jgi:hypothetical protein
MEVCDGGVDTNGTGRWAFRAHEWYVVVGIHSEDLYRNNCEKVLL